MEKILVGGEWRAAEATGTLRAIDPTRVRVWTASTRSAAVRMWIKPW